ncbi:MULTISPECIES: Rnf-Nqr domain containing protein [Pseudomonas]|uniref:Electron transport complex protein RnfA n=1 Tax=Pseudomonas hunanensis TaxID=1247546 RepID=A0ACC6K845_9PSED|nr:MULTISPECIES: Rnf-Nqr domain containing protein [Pseudomonas]MBP2263946.1 electron transport complex protein RnfA [Pseudomonas sp. BP8]MDR6714591.1 electron transport complex protein RnfA [Pseudomonas hunanensis]HDS1736077.1 electron transporter RnfA [Pseudomonas putida]
MSDYVLVVVSAALVNHLILSPGPRSRAQVHLLGASCALLMLTGMIGAKLLVERVLHPLQLHDLQLFALLPLLASLAWWLPSLLARLHPEASIEALRPALLGNVTVLGLMLQVANEPGSWSSTLAGGLCAGVALWLALAWLDDLQQRSEHADIPHALRGLPIVLIGAGVMAMAFCGFNGLFTQ